MDMFVLFGKKITRCKDCPAFDYSDVTCHYAGDCPLGFSQKRRVITPEHKKVQREFYEKAVRDYPDKIVLRGSECHHRKGDDVVIIIPKEGIEYAEWQED